VQEMRTCVKCKAPQPSTKQLSIYRFPPILILHLKVSKEGRFESAAPGG
jgi:ubiquitin C-terminal hydrolase